MRPDIEPNYHHFTDLDDFDVVGTGLGRHRAPRILFAVAFLQIHRAAMGSMTDG